MQPFDFKSYVALLSSHWFFHILIGYIDLYLLVIFFLTKLIKIKSNIFDGFIGNFVAQTKLRKNTSQGKLWKEFEICVFIEIINFIIKPIVVANFTIILIKFAFLLLSLQLKCVCSVYVWCVYMSARVIHAWWSVLTPNHFRKIMMIRWPTVITFTYPITSSSFT